MTRAGLDKATKKFKRQKVLRRGEPPVQRTIAKKKAKRPGSALGADPRDGACNL